MDIELIYDFDCPNVAKARTNLVAALAAVGREPIWTEWDRGAADSPSYVRNYGSPTVLVNGQDVSGEPSGEGGSCCRLYRSGSNRFDGAPSVEQVVAALQSNVAISTRDSAPVVAWKSSLVTLPAIGATLLPVGLCPACWPAYAGLLSAVGLGFLLDATYLFPLTAALLAMAVGSLAIGAKSRRGYGPFVSGVAASALVLVGKFVYQSNAAMYLGLAVVITNSVRNAWPVRHKDTTCPTCLRENS
jgi:hypothetical protein